MSSSRDISDYDQVIILMRHAESDANVAYHQVDRANEQRLYYPIGGYDERVKLSEQGKHQADAAGRDLRKILRADRPLDEVLVSELQRTDETAQHVMREIGFRSPVIVEPRLNKRCQGKFWNMTYLGVESLHRDEYEKYLADLEQGGLDYAPPGGDGHQDGESYNQLFARVDAFLAEQSGRTDPFLSLWVGHLSSVLAVQRKIECIPVSQVVQFNDKEAVDNASMIVYGRMLGSCSFRRINLDEE